MEHQSKKPSIARKGAADLVKDLRAEIDHLKLDFTVPVESIKDGEGARQRLTEHGQNARSRKSPPGAPAEVEVQAKLNRFKLGINTDRASQRQHVETSSLTLCSPKTVCQTAFVHSTAWEIAVTHPRLEEDKLWQLTEKGADADEVTEYILENTSFAAEKLSDGEMASRVDEANIIGQRRLRNLPEWATHVQRVLGDVIIVEDVEDGEDVSVAKAVKTYLQTRTQK